jgi:hypothetical protein
MFAVMCGATQAAAQTPPPAGQSTSTSPVANTITGVVRDASGGVVRAAVVIVTPASGAEVRGVSDSDGRFSLTLTGSGAVVLAVRATGFSPATRTIAAGANRQNLEIVLIPAPRSETITVQPPPAPPPAPKPPRPPSPPPVPGAPVINLWYGGLVTGVEAVHKSGSVAGAEAGARVWRHLDAFLEGGSFADVVPQRQLDAATPLTNYLQANYGQAAASTVKMPAVYGGIGARWVFENVDLGQYIPRIPLRVQIRPYAQFSVGGARVKRQPTFTLAGSDITGSLKQYGVTLGADMTATERRAAVTGGFGVLVPYRMFYIDVGYRITGIKTSGQSINVNRLHIGVGARF